MRRDGTYFPVGWLACNWDVLGVLLARVWVEVEEDSTNRSREKDMRSWKNSMVVRIGRRLALGLSGFAAAVAADSDVPRGERFAAESSYCGCNSQPPRWMVYASNEIMRGWTMRHRVECSQ